MIHRLLRRCFITALGMIACTAGIYAQTFHEGAPSQSMRLSPETTFITPTMRPGGSQGLFGQGLFSSSDDEQKRLLAVDSTLTSVTFSKAAPKDYPREFQFLAFYYTQAVASSVYSANPFTGEVIGRLFGDNQSKTTPGTAMYMEQRIIPFFIYQPKLFDGRAVLRAAFEIDWTWGDESYLVGGNRGGGFNGGRVNIQTQNIELSCFRAITGLSISGFSAFSIRSTIPTALLPIPCCKRDTALPSGEAKPPESPCAKMKIIGGSRQVTTFSTPASRSSATACRSLKQILNLT